MRTKQPYTLNKYLIKKKMFPKVDCGILPKIGILSSYRSFTVSTPRTSACGPLLFSGLCATLSRTWPYSQVFPFKWRWKMRLWTRREALALLILSPAHSCKSNCISVEDPLNGLARMSVLIQATPVAATDSISGVAGSMHSIHPHFLGRGVLRECFEWNPEAGGFKLR